MNQVEVKVRVKDVYGKRTFYPLCADALLFASIAGTKTLTEPVLKSIESLGYKITFQHDEVNLRS